MLHSTPGMEQRFTSSPLCLTDADLCADDPHVKPKVTPACTHRGQAVKAADATLQRGDETFKRLGLPRRSPGVGLGIDGCAEDYHWRLTL